MGKVYKVPGINHHITRSAAAIADLQSIPALLLILLVLTAETTPIPVHCSSSELHPSDTAALRSIRANLQDMPGSSYFSTWDFTQDPCRAFRGIVCELIQGQKHVTELNLGSGYAGSTGLTGKLPSAIADLNFLRQLTITPGQVGGELPQRLGQNQRGIHFVGISRNRLSGAIPGSLAAVTSLQFLDLSRNQLTGSIPRGLFDLPNLSVLSLSDNRLSGHLPAMNGGVTHLDLARNDLSGDLPPLPPSLTFLSLSGNGLQGEILSLVPLQALRYVDLSFNRFYGTVPTEVLDLPLLALHLQHNELSGSVVPSRPIRIGSVDLSYNSLSGEISPLLATARELFLNNNRFSGAVPGAFRDAMVSASLEILFLQHNYFTCFDIRSDVPLPPQSSLCIQYNCILLPPPQSTCPLKTGKQVSRPRHECFH